MNREPFSCFFTGHAVLIASPYDNNGPISIIFKKKLIKFKTEVGIKKLFNTFFIMSPFFRLIQFFKNQTTYASTTFVAPDLKKYKKII